MVKFDIETERELKKFLDSVKRIKGVDLSSYRKSFLLRRTKIRMAIRNIKNLTEYFYLIKKDPQEWRYFLDNLNINVSEFFRDPEVYFQFQKVCIPELIKRKEEKKQKIIRCWSCGCSCGEEPYSLAIVFKEALREKINNFILSIWATDIDEEALEIAKKGEYTLNSLKRLNEYFLKNYFIKISDSLYRVKDEIKKMVIFKKHNILTQRPLKNMDVIFFRNLRIYFDPLKAKDILLEIYKSLKKDGYLILGKVETIDFSLRKLFTPVDIANKIFKKTRR